MWARGIRAGISSFLSPRLRPHTGGMTNKTRTPTPHLPVTAVAASPPLPLAAPDAADTTERLLQGLIAECHAMFREQVRPSFDACTDIFNRDTYIGSAIRLAETGARLSDAIGRLRGGQQAPEMRQRITVERISRLSPPGEAEGGGG